MLGSIFIVREKKIAIWDRCKCSQVSMTEFCRYFVSYCIYSVLINMMLILIWCDVTKDTIFFVHSLTSRRESKLYSGATSYSWVLFTQFTSIDIITSRRMICTVDGGRSNDSIICHETASTWKWHFELV